MRDHRSDDGGILSVFGRVFLRARQLVANTPSRIRLLELKRHRSSHVAIDIGRNTRCSVRVRSDGRGSLIIGSGNVFGWKWAPRVGSGEILLQPRAREAEIVIGNDNTFSNNVSLIAMSSIRIGSECLFGDQVAIYDCDFHEVDAATRNRSAGPIMPVSIGNNVWLGSRVMVLKGVTVGDNSVIAAMSVVNESIPPNCIAGGNPARILKRLE